MRFILLFGALALGSALNALAQAPQPNNCDRLQSLSLSNTRITAAAILPAEPFNLPSASTSAAATAVNLPAYCRVIATIKPSANSDVVIEVWMPLVEWNTKLLGTGNVNWCGGVNTLQMALGLREHYAAVGTDRGHSSCIADASFAERPEKLQDFGYRAAHEMTLKGKEIVAAFYGSSPTHSYFIGGSSGGGQALMEVQRYPDDYDGVVAGAPTNYWTHAKAAGLWNAQLASVLSRPKLTLLHGAVLAACDSIDAIGFLDDPRQCRFNPETLLCPGDDSPQCLTQTQVEAAKKIYSGPANPRTGETIYPGLEPGSELGWPVNGPNRLFSAYFQYVVHQDPNWNWRNFDLDHDVALADQKGETALNAIDPDLRRFTARGGKLILTHGWSDASLAPQNTIRYYESVGAKLGERSQDFVRLFMVPRMGHGVGGTDQFNALAALERWVEEGVAPDRILAQQVGNIAGASTGVTMERPLCPYPQVARWKGKGSRNDAANFDCASPAAATAK